MNKFDEETYKKMGFKGYSHKRGHWLIDEWFLAERRHGGFGFLHGPFDGPAVVKTDTRTDVRVLEEWRWRSLHRDGAPARIERDGQTGVIVSEEYFQKGQLHRTDGPSVIRHNRITGTVTYEGFYNQGRKIPERHYPENEASSTPRMLAPRNRWARSSQLRAALS